MRLTEEQYNSLIHRHGSLSLPIVTPPAPPATRSKYGAVMEECQGIKFQSKKEARYFRELQARVSLGDVLYFLRQVPFDLVGGVKYRVDFMEVHRDWSIHWIDVKGFKTQTYKMKRRMV